MAGREGTVAPPERVNIRVKTEKNGQLEEVELPGKVLVIGDFDQRPEDRPIEEREPISVAKSNFDDVLRERGLTLDIEVDDVISGKKGRAMPVSLAFDTLGSFAPDRVAEQVPELRRLLEIRTALKALKGPLGSDREFRRRLTDALNNDAAVATILSEVAPPDSAAPVNDTDDNEPGNGPDDSPAE